jgi:hypothetical protein
MKSAVLGERRVASWSALEAVHGQNADTKDVSEHNDIDRNFSSNESPR